MRAPAVAVPVARQEAVSYPRASALALPADADDAFVTRFEATALAKIVFRSDVPTQRSSIRATQLGASAGVCFSLSHAAWGELFRSASE